MDSALSAIARATGTPTLWLMLIVNSGLGTVGVWGAMSLRILVGWLIASVTFAGALFCAWLIRLSRNEGTRNHAA